MLGAGRCCCNTWRQIVVSIREVTKAPHIVRNSCNKRLGGSTIKRLLWGWSVGDLLADVPSNLMRFVSEPIFAPIVDDDQLLVSSNPLAAWLALHADTTV